MANLTAIPDHYVTQFQNNWQMAVQQIQSRLKDKAKVIATDGQALRLNVFGTTSMTQVTTKNAATPNVDITLPTRWAYLNPWETSTLFGEFDEQFLGQVVLPTSDCVSAQAAAYNRLADQTIINALTGNATVTDTTTPTIYTANNATTTVALPNTQQVGVQFAGNSNNTNLTISKLREAKRILDSNEVPMEGRVLVISSGELAALLGTVEYTSSLYNSVQALVNGDASKFLGFDVVRSELLPVSGNIRTVIAYQKDMVALASGNQKSYMDVRPDISHALQVRSTATLGATRLQEKGVVTIACDTTK